MLTKKRLLAISSLLSVSAIALLGGEAAASQAKTVHRTHDPVVNLTLGMWSSSPAETKLVQDQLKAFQKIHPNIHVSIRVITGNYLQALQPMLAAHTAPDIFYVDSSYAQQLEAAGVVMPLDSLIKKYHVDLSDFHANLLKAFTWKGQIYGLPKDYNTLALESNPALLAKAGIQHPPKTWEEFTADAAKLKAKGIVPLSFPIDVARFYPFIVDFGGSFYNADKNTITINVPSNVRGMNWFLKNQEQGYLVAPNNQGASWGGEAFAQGKVAMTAEGAWIVPFMQQTAPKMKYEITDFPSLNGRSANMVYTVAYEMAKSTKNPDAAAQLLFFMTGKQALAMTAKSGLAIPSRKSEEGLFLKNWPNYKAFLDGVKDAYPYQFGLSGQDFINAINKAAETGVLKHQSAQLVLQTAEETLNSQKNY
ncbi:ABC transporter substrate-binding protein [Alicyclobacillus cellulosilyticus]|uniref:ABC transporter substrate-binding protein n=1 Tax=Alicyclobacillus cellulosilyticus TaxID=1003997 RepID=A0A917K4R2_9BACL|nr:ABC transporter substrate-binding protein [Alicyclobacillus cellulosilyticus]GGI98921.1 ABC transporter substrate-binding protein [Alicyclobacillus cellulosilyticus]